MLLPKGISKCLPKMVLSVKHHGEKKTTVTGTWFESQELCTIFDCLPETIQKPFQFLHYYERDILMRSAFGQNMNTVVVVD
jgi:hypothetical protein